MRDSPSARRARRMASRSSSWRRPGTTSCGIGRTRRPAPSSVASRSPSRRLRGPDRGRRRVGCAGRRGRPARGGAVGMRVVYSPAHLAHDVVTETVMGAVIPANEVAERAELIRATLEADGGFALEAPTEHGPDPILAVHDPGLVRFVDEAWSAAREQSIDRPSLISDTYPTFRMFEGMS